MAALSPPAIVRCLGFEYLRGRKVSRWHLFLLAVSDWVLLLFLGREKTAAAPDLAGKRVVVAKIDHLGDVLMMTPFLRELRAQVPSCRVELLLGSWCADLGELLREDGLCDDFYFYDASMLNKGRDSQLRKMVRCRITFTQAVRRLRGADVFIDLRPFFPDAILAARLAGIPHKIGFGLRGRSFLLQQRIPYEPEPTLGDAFLSTLDVLGLKRVAYERPVLARIPRAGGSALPARYFVVHPFSREQAKMLADEFWLGLIARLAEAAPVVVLGSEEDGDGTRAARLAGIPAVISRIGATTFREAAGTLEQAAAFVGVDSVFAHVALAYDRPMLVFTTPASLRAAFPTGNPRALFADAAARAAGPEALAAALLKLPGVGR